MLGNERITHRMRLCWRGKLLGQLWYRFFLNTYDRLTGNAIQYINPAGLAGFSNCLARFTLVLHVKKNHRVGGIIVPEVMMNLLEVPAVFACSCINCHNGVGEEIVSLADGTIHIWTRISGGEINEIEFRIHGRRLPDSTAAKFVSHCVLRPGIVTKVTGAWNSVKGPELFTCRGVKGFN